MAFNFADLPIFVQELRRYFATRAQGTLADTALQPGAIGSTVQAYDADLTAIAALTGTGPIERTGAGTWSLSDRVRLFGGTGGNGGTTDFNPSGNVTLDQGVYFYRNFTLTTHTVTIDRFAYIYCSGNFLIDQGQIFVNPAAPGGTPLEMDGSTTTKGGGIGFGAGSRRANASDAVFGTAGWAYPYSIQPFGSGGDSGYGKNISTGVYIPGSGGPGGGGLIIEVAGTITIIPAATPANTRPAIVADGGNGTNGTVSSGTASASGGGAGSGGLVKLSSLVSITFNAGPNPNLCIATRGGQGGNGATTGSGSEGAGGGGGGGGGWIVLTAPIVDSAGGGVSVAAGNRGDWAGTFGASPGGGFGGGFGGNGGLSISGSGTAGRYITRAWKEVA